MSRQRLFPFEDDSCCQVSSSSRYYSLTRKQLSGFPSPGGDYKSATLDRKSVKSIDKMPNLFGTLPRQQPGSSLEFRTKIKAIGAFTNMYLTSREAKDEELSYLEAVESGDLDKVEEILEKHKHLVLDEEEEECDESADEDENVRVIENGVKNETELSANIVPPESPSKSTAVRHENGSTTSITNETKICVEMVETEEEQSEKDEKRPKDDQHLYPMGKAGPVRKRRTTNRRLSAVGAGLWQKVTSNVASPLPVSLAKQNSFKHKGKNALDVESIASNDDRRKVKFNKNCKDQWGRSALFIAMIHQNLDMLELLLHYKVKSEECLYHAIDFGYYDIVELFVQNDNNTSQMIKRKDSFYPPGLTPFQLAAHKNDYVMLRILHSHGYGITPESKQRAFSKKNRKYQASPDQSSVLERAWDSSNHQLLYYRAISSPAYLVLTFTEGLEEISNNGGDLLDTIFERYAELKRKISQEPTVRSLYQPLAEQIEDFACDLLSEVRSSSDLASLLRFDPPGQNRLASQRNHLAPVQRAIEVRMKRFVAHEHSQLAISTMRLGTLFEKEHGWRTSTARFFLAMIFPILCLVFNIWPSSKFGTLLRNPMVNMSCHIMSEISFLILMIMRLVLLTMVYECDCLGTSLYPIDYIILLWIIARFVNQIKKFREVKFVAVLKNVWALNDLATLILFTLVIILKIYDMASVQSTIGPNECPFTIMNNTDFLRKHNIADMEEFRRRCTRSEWYGYESWPVTMSEAALAVIYLFIHVRAMELLYTDRTFGPLQLSIDRMFLDTFRFLCVFFVTFFAFAFAMTQLYWAWGRPKQRQLNMTLADGFQLCEQGSDYSEAVCHPVYSFIYHSLLEQYWTLYGYGWGEEPPAATKIPNFAHSDRNYEGVTVIAGQIVSMIFHAWSVVVMLNMLVAMMSHSFDRVRNNAELEWKFHRSVMWMKFIRKGIYPRPPPMNLIPSTRDLRSAYNFIRSKLPNCCSGNYIPNREPLQEKTKKENRNYRQALKHITHRYMRRNLLPDFRHDEIDQPVSRAMGGNAGLTRRGSSMIEESGVKNFLNRNSEA